jgi:DNA-binding CsgD family transcriptional regulator
MEKHNQLSAREKEVVIQVLQAKSNKQIALALGISARTVEFHLKNVYTKFQVSSRIELILKLGNATGNPISDNLGQSTVDRQEENTENRDRRNSLMDWAASFRDTVSIIGKEPEMKKRWCIYFFAGLIFGAAYWHYFSQTARFFNEFSSGGNTDGAGWLLILALLTYFSVWLIPATLPAIIEFRRSTSLRLSVMAVVAVCVSAVLGYYANYLVMLAIFGLPNMGYLLIFGQRTATFWQDWGAAFPRLIFYNFVKWAVVWILISGITGLITSSVCVALSKKNYRVIHPV